MLVERMSSHESPVDDFDHPPKRRIQRRHGACEPCRSSKTKCDGRTPCGACRSERRRQCPCIYSEKAMKLQQVTAEIRRRTEAEKQHCDDASRAPSDDEASRCLGDESRDHIVRAWADEVAELPRTQPRDNHPTPNPDVEKANMPHPISLCAVVEEFKQLKSVRGYSAQVVSRCNGFDVSMHSNQVQHREHLDLPPPNVASSPSSVPKAAPRMQVLEAKLGTVDSLIQREKLDQAWVDIASIVREAQLLQAEQRGDHTSAPSPVKDLWHRSLDLESQIGLTTGRPTHLVLPKQLRSKTKNDTLSLEDSLEETRMDLYQHIQGILALDVNDDRSIRDFLERAHDIVHHEPFNQIGLCTTSGHSAAVRDLHLNTHLLFMVTHCRVATLCNIFSHDLTNASWSDTPAADIIRAMSLDQPRQKLAYCRRMFRSANFILDSFVSLHQNNAEQSGRSWIRCHSAYIAAQVLGIAKLRHEVEWHATTEKLTKLEHIFSSLSKAYPACYLFSAAVARLIDLNSVKEPASEVTRNKHSGIKRNRGKQSAPSSVQPSQSIAHQGYLHPESSSSVSPTASMKRTIDMVGKPLADSYTSFRERFVAESSGHRSRETDSSFEDISVDHLSFFQDNSAIYSQSSSNFTASGTSTAATSFSESDMPTHAIADADHTHPGPPFAFPFPYPVFHPPMSWNNQPYMMPPNNTNALSLQIPLDPQYSSASSFMVVEPDFRYGMQSNSASQLSALNSHSSSPLQATSASTITSMGMSPAMQNKAVSQDIGPTYQGSSDDGRDGQGLSPQVKAPLVGPSDSSGRPVLGRKISKSTPHQSSASTDKNHEPSSIHWPPSSAAAIPHEAEAHHADITTSTLDTGTCPSATHVGTASVPGRHEHPSQFNTQPATQQPHPPQVIETHFLNPQPITYVNTTGGMYEPNSYHTAYQHHQHMHPFSPAYAPGSVPIPEQWRRMSFGAAGGPAAPY